MLIRLHGRAGLKPAPTHEPLKCNYDLISPLTSVAYFSSKAGLTLNPRPGVDGVFKTPRNGRNEGITRSSSKRSPVDSPWSDEGPGRAAARCAQAANPIPD